MPALPFENRPCFVLYLFSKRSILLKKKYLLFLKLVPFLDPISALVLNLRRVNQFFYVLINIQVRSIIVQYVQFANLN